MVTLNRSAFQLKPGVLFLTLLCAALSACSDDAPTKPGSESGGVNPVFSAGLHTMEELIDDFSSDNVTGIIQLYYWNRNILRQSIPGQTPWEVRESESFNGQAQFFDVPNEALASAGYVTVNDVLFDEYQTGLYQDKNVAGELELDVRFGGTPNALFIAGANDIPRYSGSVVFANAPVITNIERGQQVSRSAPLTIEWTGSGSGYVEVGVDAGNAIRDPEVGQVNGILRLVDNSGAATLSSDGLQSLPNGIVEVYVWQFDPQPVTLANDQIVYVVGMPIHEISIELID